MELPLHLLMSHILIRLPGKYLVRCMCVSKEWHTLLKSQTFAKMHLRQITQDNHRNLLAQSINPPCKKFGVIDCEALNDHLTLLRPFPFKVSYTHISFLSSCNGLVLVGLLRKGIEVDKFSDLILWNPLTSEYKILSKTHTPEKVYDDTKKVFELYHNFSDDDYRLLHVTKHDDVYIYSLKSDLWRKVDSTKIADRTSYNYWKPGACLNENLYFLRSNFHGERPSSYSVTSFDTKTEIFTKIPIPNFQNLCSSLTVERGCIHLCLMNRRTRIIDPCIMELWKMNGEDGGWMKVATYSPKMCVTYHSNIQLLHLTRDGYWLIMKFNNGYIDKVDLENGHNGNYSAYKLNGFLQEMRYIETFVSPNQYVKYPSSPLI